MFTLTSININFNQPQLQSTSTSINLNFHQPQLQSTSTSININVNQPQLNMAVTPKQPNLVIYNICIHKEWYLYVFRLPLKNEQYWIYWFINELLNLLISLFISARVFIVQKFINIHTQNYPILYLTISDIILHDTKHVWDKCFQWCLSQSNICSCIARTLNKFFARESQSCCFFIIARWPYCSPCYSKFSFE